VASDDPVGNLPPVAAIIALAVCLNSRGPVVFHQEQLTKGIRISRMHKFRATQTDDRAFKVTEPSYKLESAKEAFRLDMFNHENWSRAAVLNRRAALVIRQGSTGMQWPYDWLPG
jgi:hypothetical protein